MKEIAGLKWMKTQRSKLHILGRSLYIKECGVTTETASIASGGVQECGRQICCRWNLAGISGSYQQNQVNQPNRKLKNLLDNPTNCSAYTTRTTRWRALASFKALQA